jgi:hypothetical protein
MGNFWSSYGDIFFSRRTLNESIDWLITLIWFQYMSVWNSGRDCNCPDVIHGSPHFSGNLSESSLNWALTAPFQIISYSSLNGPVTEVSSF